MDFIDWARMGTKRLGQLTKEQNEIYKQLQIASDQVIKELKEEDIKVGTLEKFIIEQIIWIVIFKKVSPSQIASILRFVSKYTGRLATIVSAVSFGKLILRK